MNDSIIIANLINEKTGKIINQRIREKYLTEHGMWDYLMTRFDDSKSIRETITRIVNKQEKRPTCKICGKPLEFLFDGFHTFCSRACANHDAEVLEKNRIGVSKALTAAYAERKDEICGKRSATLKEHFGVEAVSPFAVAKIQQKAKNAIQQKYGVNSVLSLKEIHRSQADAQCASIRLWKSRGIDIEYVPDSDPMEVIVKNGCPQCGDILMRWSLFNNRTRGRRKDYMTLCPNCNPERNRETSIETIMKGILDKLGLEYEQHDRQRLKPYELDFWIPSLKIGIECNGCYWHSGTKAYEKQLKKRQLADAAGIGLLEYWDSQLYNDTESVEMDVAMHTGIRPTGAMVFWRKDLETVYSDYGVNEADVECAKEEYPSAKTLLIPVERSLRKLSDSVTSAYDTYVERHRFEQLDAETLQRKGLEIGEDPNATDNICVDRHPGYVEIRLRP